MAAGGVMSVGTRLSIGMDAISFSVTSSLLRLLYVTRARWMGEEMTLDNRRDMLSIDKPTAYKLAMSMYLGERCKFCGRTYETLDDLRDTVWAGYHEGGRLACKICWEWETILDTIGRIWYT